MILIICTIYLWTVLKVMTFDHVFCYLIFLFFFPLFQEGREKDKEQPMSWSKFMPFEPVPNGHLSNIAKPNWTFLCGNIRKNISLQILLQNYAAILLTLKKAILQVESQKKNYVQVRLGFDRLSIINVQFFNPQVLILKPRFN